MAEAPKLYLFVSNRDVYVTSLRGHSFHFLKGVPQHVPKICHNEVIEKGIMPVDDDGEVDLVKVNEIAGEADPKVKIVLAPEDSDERAKAIKDVLLAIAKRNRAEDFTAGGVPSAVTVTAALGWKVDLREIRPLWTEYKVEQNRGA